MERGDLMYIKGLKEYDGEWTRDNPKGIQVLC